MKRCILYQLLPDKPRLARSSYPIECVENPQLAAVSNLG